MDSQSSFIKRTGSPGTMYEPAKKQRVISNLFNIFKQNQSHNNINNTTRNSNGGDISQRIPPQQQSINMAKFNRFRSEHLGNRNVSDITALKLYHDSLKQQNQRVFSRLAGESPQNDQRSGILLTNENDAEQEDDHYDVTNSTVINRGPSIGMKRPYKESRDSSLVIPRTQLSLRQQVARINPKERSNLINLKKKMKLDAYYRRKMNYLNYYNQNSAVNSANSTVDYSMMSLNNTTFNPNDTKTELSSTKKIALKNNKHIDKKPKTMNVTNTTGVFSGSFMYDLDEADDDVEVQPSTKEQAPVSYSISYKHTKDKYAPKALAPGLENVLGAQKKRVKKEDEKATGTIDTKVASLPAAPPNPESVGPSSAFSFMNKTTEPSMPKVDGQAPALAIVGDAKKPSTTPAFSFGGASNSTSQAAPAAAPSSSFSFSTKTASKPAAESPALSLGSSGTAAKPFSFGAKTPQLETVKDSGEPTKTALSFGAPASKKTDEAANSIPSFSFGAPAEKKEEPPKAGFSFSLDKQQSSKPAFSFGTGPSAVEKKGDASKVPDTTAAQVSSSENTTEQPKPSFNFSFGKSEPEKNGNEAAKSTPSFNFRAATKPAETDASAAQKPAFGAGASSFQFGGSKSEAKEEEKKEEQKEEPTKPAFNFGNGAAPAALPSFSFGSKTTADSSKPATPATASTGFSFGKRTADNDDKDNETDLKRKLPPLGGSTGFSFGNGAGAAQTGGAGSSSSSFFGSLKPDTNGKIESPKPTQMFGFGTGIKNNFGESSGSSAPAGTATTEAKASPASAFSFNTQAPTSNPAAPTANAMKPSLSFANVAASAGASGPFGGTAASSKESTPAVNGAGDSGAPKFSFAPSGVNGASSAFGQSGKSTPVFGAGAAGTGSGFQFGASAAGAGAAGQNVSNIFGGANAGPAANANPGTASTFNFGGSNQSTNGSAPNTVFNPSRSATPGAGTGNGAAAGPGAGGAGFNFGSGTTPVNPASVFGRPGPAPGQGQQLQPGNMFGSSSGFGAGPGAGAGNMFGQPQQQQQQPGNIFGAPAAAPGNNVFAPSVSPVPSAGTPIPGRKLARMRQPRSHR